MEPGVTLPAPSGKSFVWAAAGEPPGRVPARRDTCVASPAGTGLGTRRAPGSWGLCGWAVPRFQEKLYYFIFEHWRCSVAPRSIFMIAG